MPRKKATQPLTKEKLIEILDFVYVPQDEPEAVYNMFVEDCDLTSGIKKAVEQLNDYFGLSPR